ncbi:MAG: hypothetical protein AB1656_05170 [Candidatus Omnitrophota bacterium]
MKILDRFTYFLCGFLACVVLILTTGAQRITAPDERGSIADPASMGMKTYLALDGSNAHLLQVLNAPQANVTFGDASVTNLSCSSKASAQIFQATPGLSDLEEIDLLYGSGASDNEGAIYRKAGSNISFSVIEGGVDHGLLFDPVESATDGLRIVYRDESGSATNRKFSGMRLN